MRVYLIVVLMVVVATAFGGGVQAHDGRETMRFGFDGVSYGGGKEALDDFLSFSHSIDFEGALVISTDGDLIITEDLAADNGAGQWGAGQDVVIDVGGVLTLMEGVMIKAGDGANGKNAEGFGEVIGGNGGRGGNILISAAWIIATGNKIEAGGGGHGGNATAIGDPDAVAVAGNGGFAGGVFITAMAVDGWFAMSGGDGGRGGNASAAGQAACDGSNGGDGEEGQGDTGGLNERGGDGVSRGGDGECGPLDGQGGRGGSAIARGGEGGMAVLGDGGRGGDAIAEAGRSGDGMDACFSGPQEAGSSDISRAGDGGYTGYFRAIGGQGGEALMFSGGRGGDGGNAFGSGMPGKGGNATLPVKPGVSLGSDPSGWYEVEGGRGGDGPSGGNGGIGVGDVGVMVHGTVCDDELEEAPSPVVLAPLFLIVAVVWFVARRQRHP
jgi:hypothetical protein